MPSFFAPVVVFPWLCSLYGRLRLKQDSRRVCSTIHDTVLLVKGLRLLSLFRVTTVTVRYNLPVENGLRVTAAS